MGHLHEPTPGRGVLGGVGNHFRKASLFQSLPAILSGRAKGSQDGFLLSIPGPIERGAVFPPAVPVLPGNRAGGPHVPTSPRLTSTSLPGRRLTPPARCRGPPPAAAAPPPG